MNEYLEMLANDYGLKIVGTCDYFDQEDHEEMTADLEKAYTVIKGLIREHDKLAREIGKDKFAINDKRGRKAENKSVPTTAEDVLKRLSK